MKSQHYTQTKGGEETGIHLEVPAPSKSVADEIVASIPCSAGSIWEWRKEVQSNDITMLLLDQVIRKTVKSAFETLKKKA